MRVNPLPVAGFFRLGVIGFAAFPLGEESYIDVVFSIYDIVVEAQDFSELDVGDTGFLGDLGARLLLEGFSKFHMSAGYRPGSRAVARDTLSDEYLPVPENDDADGDQRPLFRFLAHMRAPGFEPGTLPTSR